MDEAFESIAEFKKQVADLMPKKRKAIELVNDHVVNVESQRQQYIEVLTGIMNIQYCDFIRVFFVVEKLK